MKKLFTEFRSFFYLLPNILSVFFTKPETIKYPGEDPQITTGFRGSVQIHADNCVGCSLCVLDCPAAALELQKESKTNYKLIHFRDKCTYCGQCEKSCKFNAIYLDHTYIQPSDNRMDFRTILVVRRREGQ